MLLAFPHQSAQQGQLSGKRGVSQKHVGVDAALACSLGTQRVLLFPLTPHQILFQCIFAAATDPDNEGPQFHSRWFDWEGITESIAYASAVQDLPSRSMYLVQEI